MATIDKNSIVVSKTSDSSVYKVDFDFTDSTSLDINQGWLVPWLHTSFMSGTTATSQEFNAAALDSMSRVRRPTIEIAFENALRAAYGSSVVRSDPNAPEPPPQKVNVVLFSTSQIVPTETVH